jgi:carboxyl-terminal processing protease
LVTTKYKNKFHNEIYPSMNTWKVFDKKIVILINGSSASASEITAWALREYNKAILVWEKTYWKGSVQKPFNLNDWSMVKLTIAKWFTPKDKNIDWEWIEADIEVKIKKQDYDLEECIKVWKCDKDLEQKDFEIYDRQLEEAKNVLKSFIKKWTLQVVIDEENERLGNVVEEE